MLRLSHIAQRGNFKNAALSSLDLKNPDAAATIFGGFSTDSGTIVSEKSSVRLSSVYRAVNLIATSIATLPKNVIETLGTNRQKRPDHPVAFLLRKRVNEAFNSYKFFEFTQWYIQLWGNCYWRIYYRANGFTPDYLRFYHPDEVDVKFNTEKTRKFYTIRNTGEVLSSDQMLHFMGPSFDGLKGLSKIRYAAAQSIGIGLETDKFQATFFRNGIQSSGVVELPEGVNLASNVDDDEEMSKFIASFNNAYGGSDNRHKIMFLEKGMKFSPISMPLADAQFIESKKFTIGDIARFFDVPMHLLMEMDSATNNNIEHQSREFLTYCIKPNWTNMKFELNDKLFTDRELETMTVFAEMNSIIQTDTKTKAEFYKVMLGGASTPAAYTQNEVRAMEDMNPDTDDLSNRLFRPLNMTDKEIDPNLN
jgi:HK97 family phage portal protein